MRTFARVVLAAMLAVAAMPALALQCRALADIAEGSPTVVIARPVDRVRRPSQVPGHVWVRFAVVETLRGASRPSLDALCPVDDRRCRPAEDAPLLVLALPTPPAPPTLTCRLEYLDPPPGMGPPDPRLQQRMRAWRAARR
ncbi:MAG TPA: hypothetical protein VEY50_06325 [Lysobacter sp.]|nr:hypothetical protein [Lysobacter sp.]